ncbi:hypothetical protein [Halobacillus salinus]|uniref:Four-helix bundle copper-binding protein n=1 Tax=Halobacillus salinus TaxID=192814 RepID=A0A4Z0GY91_9BACI|nr:hypothetical protein [Halobacillus salinus]TGB01605.1 hypothetical protein E4663_15730 [Halobacillus salinus]
MSVCDPKILVERTNLLKECADAYAYAVEVVSKNSVMAEDISRSCAEVCYQSAEECLSLDHDALAEELYNMCYQYAVLCEKIIGNNKPAYEKAQLKESS